MFVEFFKAHAVWQPCYNNWQSLINTTESQCFLFFASSSLLVVLVIWTCLSGFLSSMRLGMKQTGCGWSGHIDWFRPSSWHLPPTILQSLTWCISEDRQHSQLASLIVCVCGCKEKAVSLWFLHFFYFTVESEFDWQKTPFLLRIFLIMQVIFVF